MTPREELIEAMAAHLARAAYGDHVTWPPTQATGYTIATQPYEWARAAVDDLLAHRDLLLEALGGERRGTEDQVTEWAEDEMGWRSLPVTIQRYDAWRFPVSEEAQK